MAFGIDDFALLLLGGGLLGAGQAGLNMAGTALTYGEQRKLQKKAQQFEAEQSKINRDWMTEMSNSAHQREIADLRSAGLNPILSATGGSGASTPSASTAVSGNMPDGPDYSGLGDSMTKGFLGAIESGLDMKKASAMIDATNAAAKLDEARTKSQELDNLENAATLGDRKDLKSYEVKKAAADAASASIRNIRESNALELEERDMTFQRSPLGRRLFLQKNLGSPYKNSWLHDIFTDLDLGREYSTAKQYMGWK